MFVLNLQEYKIVIDIYDILYLNLLEDIDVLNKIY